MKNRLSINVQPCKRCGAKTGLIFAEYNVFRVRCMTCHAETPRYQIQQTAFQKWNEGVFIPQEEQES